MNAELLIFGKRLDMAPRTHRQTLVILIYACLVALMTGFWFIDRWHVTGVYMIFATIAVNRLLLGGYNYGGLIKPFSGKAPSGSVQAPLFLVLGLRMYKPEPEEPSYRNDERELQQRDRAHFYAYQGLAVFLAVIWIVANFNAHSPRLLAQLHIPADILIYSLALAAVVISQTLPQSILLWTEPDMPEFDPED